MKVDEIDNQIRKYLNKHLDRYNLFNLMVLIENKLNLIYEPEDLLPFSSLIRKLELPEDQKNYLIKFRNQLAHNVVSEGEVELIRKDLMSTIIPLILSLSQNNTQRNKNIFEEKISNKLKLFADDLGYNLIRNKSISIDDKKKTRIEIDVIFESESESIIFEIKSSSKRNFISVWIDQLKSRLKIFGSRFGVLVLEHLYYQEMQVDNYEILIIGELEMHQLPDWIYKIRSID